MWFYSKFVNFLPSMPSVCVIGIRLPLKRTVEISAFLIYFTIHCKCTRQSTCYHNHVCISVETQITSEISWVVSHL